MTQHLVTRFRTTALLALAASGLLTACDTPRADPVLATFPGGEVTQSEADAFLARRFDRSLGPRDVLHHLALTETLAQAARANELDLDPKLALRLRQIEDQPWVATLRAKMAAEVEPTEEAIEEYLEENRSRLSKPRKVRLSNIFKRSPKGSPAPERAAARLAMDAIHGRLLAGGDFAEIATQESEAVNRYRGGRMGAVAPGQLKKELETVAFALTEGEISPVIAVDEGFVLLLNSGFVEATTMSEEEALERIRTAMRRWNREAAWEALRTELFDASGVVVFDDLIEAAGPETVIGSVDGETLTYGEIDALARSQGTGPKPPRLTDARIRGAFLSQAFTRLAAERSREQGLAPAPEALAKAVSLQRALLADAELAWRATERDAPVSEAEARDFFAANPTLFTVPAEALLSLIQLRLDEGGTEALRSQTLKARTVLERVRLGELSFADAAREVSQHPSAAAGGDVGWKPRRWASGLGPNVLDAFNRLKPGQVSDVVRQDHLWILQLRDTRPARTLTFEESRDEAIRRVRQERLDARVRVLREALIEDLDARLEIRTLPELPERPSRGERAVPAGRQGERQEG